MIGAKTTNISKSETPTSSERNIPALYIRVMLDVSRDILGDNAVKIILRHADLEEFIDEPPPYALDVHCDSAQTDGYIRAFFDILGKEAYRAIAYRNGYLGFKKMVEVIKELNIQQYLHDLPVEKGYRERFNLLIPSAGGGELLEFSLDRIVLDLPKCILCKNIKSEKTFCNFWVGFLEAQSEEATGKRAKVVETRCKACGDSSCRFEIVS